MMKLKFREFGSGEPIVLLHAFPLSSAMWNAQIAPIIEKGRRLILPDFPGFGKTDIETEISVMEDLAAALSGLLAELKIERAVIGGLSMGGYVALNFMRMFPEKVSGLILADTNSAADSADKRAARFELTEKVKEKGTDILLDEMLPNLISEKTQNDNSELVNFIAEEFRKATEKGVIAASLGMAARQDQTSFLKEIKVPTMLIFGEDDKITNLDAAKTLRDGIQNSTLVTIPDAGHYSNLEQAEAFNKAVTDFLDKLK